MLALFGILIIIACLVLGLIVLIQNPKGGGLSGALGGFGNQLMGVKQTTDVLEKGTWVFAAIVGILCLVSPAFISKDAAAGSSKGNGLIDKTTPVAPKQQPATTTQPTSTPYTAPDTTKTH
jgi:preprotein translocase subunit SecG